MCVVASVNADNKTTQSVKCIQNNAEKEGGDRRVGRVATERPETYETNRGAHTEGERNKKEKRTRINKVDNN